MSTILAYTFANSDRALVRCAQGVNFVREQACHGMVLRARSDDGLELLADRKSVV